MEKYLIIDGMLHGTGIRNYREGGYIEPSFLGLTPNLIQTINSWLLEYENEFYKNYENADLVQKLDEQGLKIAQKLKKELPEYRIEYFSDAKLERILLE